MSEKACPHTESAYDYLTDRLTGADRSAFEEHLAGCESCRDEMAALQEALGHLAAWTPPRLSPAFRNGVLARLEAPRPGLAARLGGWFTLRPLPLVAGALVAAGLVVAVIGFFPQILSELTPRHERRIVRTDRIVREEIPGRPKRTRPADVVRPRSQPVGKIAPPSPAPPPPPPPRVAVTRPTPPRAPAGTAAKSIAPPARPRVRMAARPRSIAPGPGAADRSRSGVRPAPPARPAPRAPLAPVRRQFQQYSVQPGQKLLSPKPSTSISPRPTAGLTRGGRGPMRAFRPAPAPKTTSLKAITTALREKQRLPQNLAMVLSLVERYGGTVRKPYQTTARGLILEVTVPPANRRVFLTRLRGLKGQGITRLGPGLTPIRVLVSKSPRTGPDSNKP